MQSAVSGGRKRPVDARAAQGLPRPRGVPASNDDAWRADDRRGPRRSRSSGAVTDRPGLTAAESRRGFGAFTGTFAGRPGFGAF